MDRWDPLRDIFSLRARVNRLFEEVSSPTGERCADVWAPAVDVYETREEFVVKAELPGLREEDITITVEDNLLRLGGERTSARAGKRYYQVEREWGAFSRSFVLPEIVDRANIKATLKDGILNIVLPKKSAAAPKNIEIT